MILDGITLSGGEPFKQPQALTALLIALKKARPSWNVLTFSGYPLEYLRRDVDCQKLLAEIDILVDGHYLQQHEGEHPLTASKNQQVHYHGESKSKIWTLTNPGRGYLNGEILLKYYGRGLSLDNYLVEGNEQTYQVTLKIMPSLPEGLETNALTVRSNAGEIEIPVSFIVRAPPKEKRSWWQMLLDYLF